MKSLSKLIPTIRFSKMRMGRQSLVFAVVAFAFAGCSDDSSERRHQKISDSNTSKTEKSVEVRAREAEAAEANLSKTTRRPAAISKDKSSSGFSLQVGTFSNKANADKLTEQLKKEGLSVYLRKVDRPNGVILHAVRLDEVRSILEAKELKQHVEKVTRLKPIILHLEENRANE